MTGEDYLRVQVEYRGRLGVEVGVFVAVDHLRRASRLTAQQEARYLDIDDWFLTHLPNPDFYADGNTLGAVTWFKQPVRADMAAQVDELCAMLASHGVTHHRVISSEPGDIVYEDAFQVGVVPRFRGEATPWPDATTLRPTSAGSKRDLPQDRPPAVGGPGHLEVTVVTDVGEALTWAPRVWPCYDEVFGDRGDYETWRTSSFERHARREGYRLALATAGERVVGFAWGYVGRRGQYWTDLVHDILPPEVVETWVGDHFEMVELAVLDSHRRHGIGQRLHDHLLDGVDRRCLLGTSDDPSDPAVALYLRAGWERLGVLRPGVQVLGRR